MKGYSSANGDNRGILERFLPSTYRTTKDGSNAHNAFLGAIKGSIETTRDDMEEMSLQVYFTRATGKFLDLYGKYVGLSRNYGEEDQSYRNRIVKYIKTKRGTIEAIIDGIKNELGDPELPVSIYETWRNIFIMNQSTLNGLDYIMGEKYRYAVIEITVGKYVEPDVLTDIVDRYKAYGVKVLYRYALGMSDEVWNDPVDFSQEFIDNDSSYTLTNYLDPYYKKVQVTMGDSPITKKELSLFKMNASKLNGSDVISGNPENAYIFDYTNSPSYHILGYVPSSSTPDSDVFKDPYDYVYQGTKVDLSTIGGRNLLLTSSTMSNTSSWVSPSIKAGETYQGMNISANTVAWSGPKYIISDLYNRSVINENDTYTYSAFVRNTSDTDIEIGFYGTNNVTTFTEPNGILITKMKAHTDWTRLSVTFKFKNLSKLDTTSIRFEPRYDVTNGHVNQSGFKLEKGSIFTDWTPAPEDTPKTYVYPFTTEPYLVTSRKDSNSYTFLPGNSKSTVLGVNVSRYFINNGYDDLISKYDRSSINSVNIYTKGSEIGLPRTDIKVTGTDGKEAKGQFNVLGGRNLLLGSRDYSGDQWLNLQSISGTYKGVSIVSASNNGTILNYDKSGLVSDNKINTSDTYVLSMYVKNNSSAEITITFSGGSTNQNQSIVSKVDSKSDWVMISKEISFWTLGGNPLIGVGLQGLVDNSVLISCIKLEGGNTPTDWTPAVEEVSGYGIDYIYDNNSSTGSYHYVLNTPSPIKTIAVDDYYNYGYSNRLVTIKTPNIELPLGIFKGQSTGYISIPDYSYPDKNFLIASTNRFKLNIDSSSKGVMIYNYTSKNWENYDFNKYYEIGNYIQDAKSIQGAYMLVKFTDSKFDLKYFDLEFDTATIPYTSNSVGYSNKLGQFFLDQSKLG